MSNMNQPICDFGFAAGAPTLLSTTTLKQLLCRQTFNTFTSVRKSQIANRKSKIA